MSRDTLIYIGYSLIITDWLKRAYKNELRGKGRGDGIEFWVEIHERKLKD